MQPGRGLVVGGHAAGDGEKIGQMLLGEIMLRRGMIREADIDAALEFKRNSGLPFGECLVRIGAATQHQVETALAYQDECRRLVEGIAERRVPAAVGGSSLNPEPASANKLELSKPKFGGESKGGGGLRLVSDCLLGEVMAECGLVTEEDVQKALASQRVTGMRMGEALVDLGCCTWDDVQRGIEIQRRRRGH
ncbi:MAG TPA: hypothetical protein ENJ09_01920 [Planctomycetes bacterium]|nr:hypothetical protein [Planctomycetota bacterium]